MGEGETSDAYIANRSILTCEGEYGFPLPSEGRGLRRGTFSDWMLDVRCWLLDVFQIPLSPALSHPMGEVESSAACIANRSHPDLRERVWIPSPIGWERVRERDLWIHLFMPTDKSFGKTPRGSPHQWE